MRRLLLSLSVLVGLPLAAGQVGSALPGPAGGELTVAASVVPEVAVADHALAEPPARYAAAVSGTTAPVVPVRCDGNGVTGRRVQAVYVRAANRADRSALVLAKSPQWLGIANGVVARSAAGRRQVRFVTDRACRPTVVKVVLPAGGAGSFRAIVDGLKARGFARPDRKYLVWADADLGCGVGTTRVDDSPGLDNANNTSTGHGVVYPRCWGGRTEAHELVHTLGAVMRSAPNATDYGHCRDDFDVMCYADGPGTTMRKTCPHPSRMTLLDCRGDSYFNVTPRPGGYLSRHWNVASSAFLIGAPAALIRPSGPATLNARWDTGARQLVLTWPAATVSGGTLAGHRVYVDNRLVATVGPRTLTATLPLENGSHTYRVAGFTSAGDSRDAPSVTVSVNVPDPEPAPVVPPVEPTMPPPDATTPPVVPPTDPTVPPLPSVPTV